MSGFMFDGKNYDSNEIVEVGLYEGLHVELPAKTGIKMTRKAWASGAMLRRDAGQPGIVLNGNAYGEQKTANMSTNTTSSTCANIGREILNTGTSQANY